jgi:hypothetical protein
MAPQINGREDDMTIDRALNLTVLLAAITMGCLGPAMAQVCNHEGPVVTCDDGRRGVLSGDGIICPTAPDRTHRRVRAPSSATNHR